MRPRTVRLKSQWRAGVVGVLLAGFADRSAAGAELTNVNIRESTGPVQTGLDPSVAGLLGCRPNDVILGTNLYVFGLRPGDRSICIHVERLNGSYRADIKADLLNIASASDTARFTFARQDTFPKMGPGKPAIDFAIRAKVSGDRQSCEADGELLVASWRPGLPKQVEALLLVSEGYATSSIGDSPRAPCSDVSTLMGSDEQHTSFDTSCQVSPPQCNEDTRFFVRRRDYYGGVKSPIKAHYRPFC